MNIEKLAGIDIGSNAIRLLVANVITNKNNKNPSFRKSALVRVPIRLGADSFIKGLISDTNKDRMIKAMVAFKLLMEVHGVTRYYACATSAMREAENGEEVAAEIFTKTGVKNQHHRWHQGCRPLPWHHGSPYTRRCRRRCLCWHHH